MANPLNLFAQALAQIGEAARAVEMQKKYGPNWREDMDYTRATRGFNLRQNEMTEAKGRITLADQLAGLIGSSAEGWADSVPTPETMTLGAEDGGRGYAMNVPGPETVPPDFADVVPDDLGELTGFDRDALVRMGLGKARQSKRALQELKGEQSLAALDVRGQQTADRDRSKQEFQRTMEEFKQGGRMDLARLTAKLREGLAAYNQNRQDQRYYAGLSQDQVQFYDRLNAVQGRWEQEQDLRELSARRQALSAQLTRNAELSEQGRAQVIFELGVINGRLANMGLSPNGTTPHAAPATPGGPPDSASSLMPNPRPQPTGRPVPVTSMAEVAQLPDGTLFTVGGKTYRKQGGSAVPVP